MKRITLVILATAFAVGLVACAKTENTSNSNSNSSTSAGKSMATPGTSTSSTTASTGDKIGVPECDDFIAKYESCVNGKVPEMARAQYQSAVKQWKESWKKLAENPQTKGTLAAACKQAADQQAAALKTFGCTF
jgi:Ni/Co efflux regulator RcnB